MAILFMGGEELDFERLYGSAATSVSAATFRSGFARASLMCPGLMGSAARGLFTQPSANFWFTARIHADATVWIDSGWTTFLTFSDGLVKRLGFQVNGTTRALRVVKWDDGGNPFVLTGTSESFIQSIALHRIDVQITYGTTGRIRFYFNQVQFADFTGDITSGSTTTLNSFTVSTMNNSDSRATYYSEIIAAERDTRTLSLRTHAPVATSTGHEWLGSQSDVAEITLNETTMITTEEADKLAKFTVNSLPAGNFSVRAFSVAAYAARGSTGPQGIQLGVGTNGTDSFSATKTLDTGWTRISQIFETNPVTNTVWTINEVNSIEITAKSKS